MDRIDKFINNRSPKKIIVAFLGMLIFSAVVGLILSQKIADCAARENLQTYLLTVDSEKAEKYGFYSDMPLSLIPIWAQVRNISFWAIFLSMGATSFCWACFSIHEVFLIYDDLECLSRECKKSADKLENIVSLHGEDVGCMRRTSESAKLLASRMMYLNSCLESERNYLSQFLADFSHQIKTALAVIRLNTDMLEEMENLSLEQCEQLNNEIQLNLSAMENLVVQTIKLARLESNAIEYNMQGLHLADTCRTALKRINPILREKNISVNTNFKDDIILNHDKGWLCEAIENVLKNSADHSECTEISLQTEENPAMTKILIIDNGKGIAQKDIPHIFEPFAKKSKDITMKSAGLGMSIAQKIVRNHGGEIIVYSKSGEGSRFEFAFVKI